MIYDNRTTTQKRVSVLQGSEGTHEPQKWKHYRRVHWSDTKKEYPMLPRNSEVQKCLRCGKYYFLADAKTLPSGEDPFLSLFDKLSNELDNESV